MDDCGDANTKTGKATGGTGGDGGFGSAGGGSGRGGDGKSMSGTAKGGNGSNGGNAWRAGDFTMVEGLPNLDAATWNRRSPNLKEIEMTAVDVEADRKLKANHRALWASGDYPAVAAQLIPALGPELVRASGLQPGDRVLDVAAGSGNAAIPAAVAGAIVTASDLTPELFAAGQATAAQRGVELEWVEADAEALPFANNSFDVVMSCVGAMFAPHHQSAADELVRVVRAGGTIAMINWTPEGFIGNLFATMKPYAPPPPPGAGPPPLWGDEAYVRALFGDRVSDLTMRRQTVTLDHCTTPQEFHAYWKRNYGPIIAAYKFNADDPTRVAALDHDFLDFLTCWNQGDAQRASWDAEYLLVTATKR